MLISANIYKNTSILRIMDTIYFISKIYFICLFNFTLNKIIKWHNKILINQFYI